MELTRKSRFVAGDHTKEAPLAITYSIVVSRDSVGLAFIIVALNGLDIMSCDLENTYLNATNRENIWFEGGIKYGEDKGKVLVVVQDLYGLNSEGSACRAVLAGVLVQLGFKSTKADPDVCIRSAVRPDGFKYY